MSKSFHNNFCQGKKMGSVSVVVHVTKKLSSKAHLLSSNWEFSPIWNYTHSYMIEANFSFWVNFSTLVKVDIETFWLMAMAIPFALDFHFKFFEGNVFSCSLQKKKIPNQYVKKSFHNNFCQGKKMSSVSVVVHVTKKFWLMAMVISFALDYG